MALSWSTIQLFALDAQFSIYVLIRFAQTNVNHFTLKIPVIQTNHTRNMVGCASGSKTHMNIQSKEGALFLTTKKADYQRPKQFLISFRDHWRVVPFDASCGSPLLSDAFHLRSRMQARPTRTQVQPASRPYFYQRFLSASVAFEYVVCLLGKVSWSATNLARCFHFRFQCFQLKNGIQIGIKLKLLLVTFGL